MRVLAHIHTFNDADIIDWTIEALLRQTRPVDGILVVDNASTDGTLDGSLLENVTVLRHIENLGTSGTVITGMRFALDRDYDWIWIFDADSTPEPDALGRLLDLYASWPSGLQDETAFLACLPRDQRDDYPYHGQVFLRHGVDIVRPPPEERYYPCHVTIWSGCLYRLGAVRRIGLPNPNYVLDWGDFEYGYHVMRAGYRGFIHQDSVLHHNIRGYTSLTPVELKLGPVSRRFYDFPPIRCYYKCRNMLYFALYDVSRARSSLVRHVVWRVFRLTVNFLLRPRNHGAQIAACLRGIWHGVTGNMAARY
jgi:GT2 family glycosyltransferase